MGLLIEFKLGHLIKSSTLVHPMHSDELLWRLFFVGCGRNEEGKGRSSRGSQFGSQTLLFKNDLVSRKEISNN